jgi:hypothetical protein
MVNVVEEPLNVKEEDPCLEAGRVCCLNIVYECESWRLDMRSACARQIGWCRSGSLSLCRIGTSWQRLFPSVCSWFLEAKWACVPLRVSSPLCSASVSPQLWLLSSSRMMTKSDTGCEDVSDEVVT